MSDAAVTSLLENVTDILTNHADLISGAEHELESLRDELGEMKILLENASKKRYREEHYQDWERKLRNVVYEVEDAIDICITQAAAMEKNKNAVRRAFNTKRISLAESIKSLREGKVKTVLDKATIEMANLEIVDESDRSEETIVRNKAMRQDNVVGFEDAADTLIRYLLEESSGLDVVTIVGMPGLGKTTLAWRIYQDPTIQYEFLTLIWVVVSQEFNKKDVLLTIVKRFTYQDMSSRSEEELVILVGDYLERSKFLIILDDVWTSDIWKEICDFLPKHNNKGRILITTRNVEVAWNANHTREPYKLRFLSGEESWILLQLEVFGSLDVCPPELEKFGKLIANKCDGLPLAIIVIGGILADKLSIAGGDAERKKEWKIISENMDIYINTRDEDNSIEKMISLSYAKLPYDLRDCFLYVGAMFPEDSEILAWELIQLWIAEGFIKLKPNGKSLEETAYDNLNDLINRNLVMIDKIKPNGEVKTCRVHYNIREFCKNEAAFEKQNLFQEVKKASDGTFAPKEIHKCRRLCVHSFVKEFFLTKAKVKRLPQTRSFLSFTKPIDLARKDVPAVIDVFELLRVFNAKTIKFPEFPVKFTQLVHLRYLTLSCDELKMIPEAISKLWNLQTLTVDTLSSTLEIKANIWHMMKLRHVKTKASIILNYKDVKGTEGGENLQTLSKLSPQSCKNDVFEKARNLKTLGIRGELATFVDSKCMEKLHMLKKLKLVNHVYPKAASKNPLRCLPCTFPNRLKFLTLSNTYLDWSHMSSTVGNIPNLQVLKLKDKAFSGDSWDSVDGGFRNLEYLYIARSDLMLWRIKDSGDPFPKLKTIVLKNCEKLYSVPKELVKKLHKLEMQRVAPSAVISAKQVEMERNMMFGFKLIISPGGDEQI